MRYVCRHSPSVYPQRCLRHCVQNLSVYFKMITVLGRNSNTAEGGSTLLYSRFSGSTWWL